MSIISLLNSLPGSVAQGLIWGIMALGVYITFKILDYADLTVDGSLATGGAVCAVAIAGGVNPWLALIMAIIAGMLAGLITGLLHTALGIPSILSGILSQLALYSINMRIMGKSNVTISRTEFDLIITSGEITKAIIIGIVFVAAVIAILYWFFGTEIGCAIRATGNNEPMARAEGINTNTAKVLGLVISNGLVGLSGGLLAQYQGCSDINMGRGAIVIGLAAVVIGEMTIGRLNGFVMRLTGTVFGAVIYYAVLAIVIWAGLSTTDLKLFSAAIVALFLAIPYLKGKYSVRPKAVKAVPAGIENVEGGNK